MKSATIANKMKGTRWEPNQKSFAQQT